VIELDTDVRGIGVRVQDSNLFGDSRRSGLVTGRQVSELEPFPNEVVICHDAVTRGVIDALPFLFESGT
jgi:hypothetical protein